MLLSDYRTAVRDILHDPYANFYSVAAVDRWINRARRQVAEKGQCVRILPPPTAAVSSLAVTSAGSGYTTATVEISAPDSNYRGNVQATATANLSGGQVQSITVTAAGAGYVAPATATITGDGTGATCSVTLGSHVTTVPDQEVYTLTSLAALVPSQPGLGGIIGVQSVAVSWGALKPVLSWRDWSFFQMYLRSNSMSYQNYPSVWSQYGQGESGSLYVWPVPNQYSAMEVDCYFNVADLSDSQTVDLIPSPWNEPVHYYAAYLAYLNAQRRDDARTMLGEHERLMAQARMVVSPPRTPDPYGEG